MRSKVATTLVTAMFLLFAACSPVATPSPTPPTETASPAATPTPAATGTVSTAACVEAATGTPVTIAEFAFDPADLAVKAGTTVTWTNRDPVGHTATADDGSFDCRPLPNGASLSFTFETAGTYEYHCAIHPSIKGRITVNP